MKWTVSFLFLLNESDSVVLIMTRNHNIIMYIMPWKIWGEFCRLLKIHQLQILESAKDKKI